MISTGGGAGSDNVDKVFVVVEFRDFLMLIRILLSLYLAITMRTNLKRLHGRKEKKILLILIKVEKGKGGSPNVDFKNILSVNIFYFGRCG